MHLMLHYNLVTEEETPHLSLNPFAKATAFIHHDSFCRPFA